MSPSRRHKTSERRTKSSRRQLADDLSELEPQAEAELPTLEPADELEELAPDSPVAVDIGPADEPAFDTEVVLDLPDMDKAAVAGAIDAPLRWAAGRNAAALRYRSVVVRFAGETLISTAAKDKVGEVLRDVKAVRVVVRRGYGDELVHEGELPRVATEVRVEGDVVHVDVDNSQLDVSDLAVALQAEMAKVTASAKGKTYEIAFRGAAPDAEARSLLRAELLAAGADRARIGEQVLFDRELESRINLASSAGSAAIQVTPADDEATTLAAFDLVLAPNAHQLAGRKVFVEFLGRSAREQELLRLVEISRAAQPARLEIAAPSGEPDQIWPPLVEVEAGGDEALVRVVDVGRSKGGLAVSFAREVAAVAGSLRGKRVTVAWPADFELDPALEKACIVDALAGAGAVACTFGGDHREPFLPLPLSFRAANGGQVATLDTDAGKPGELVRAIERRVAAAGEGLRGKTLRVEIKGAGSASRGVLRALSEGCAHAGVARLEVEDHGVVDMLLPPLLTVSKAGAHAVRVAAEAAGRTPAQVELALQRELEPVAAGDKTTWTVQPSALQEALVAAAVARGAARVLLDGEPPLQVHPPLLMAEGTEDRLVLRATPGDQAEASVQLARELPAILRDAGGLGARTVQIVWPGAKAPPTGALAELVQGVVAAGPQRVLLDDGRGRSKQLFPEVVPEYVTLLGRRDDAAAPLLMVGIDAGTGEEHAARVLAKLESHADLLQDRQVLLVLQTDDGDASVGAGDPLIAAVRAFVDPRAAATLVYRGLDARRRPHFVVAHSRVDALAVGARFADPRRR
ncbi:MAG: hypothetical protein R3F56_06775 [Planctomycetota bacterium]